MSNPDEYRCDIVIRCVAKSDLNALRAALADGNPVDCPDTDGRTALIHAAIEGNINAASVLLNFGARTGVADRLGYTALHYAAQNYFPDVADVLIEHGAPVDVEDIHGNTPLGRAVFESRGRDEMISLLLKAGADRNHRNKRGKSPLDLAKTIANYDVLKFLAD